MFRNVLFRIALFCWLVLAFSANAAIDGFANTANPSLQNVSSKMPVSESGFRSDSYQLALAAPVVDVPTHSNTTLDDVAINDGAFPKVVWALACGLAFLGVMKRRLSR